MGWTRPKTWSSEPLTSLDLNTYVRDNQNHLKGRLDNAASHSASGVALLSTTATAFVDVDATNLSLTLTTHGGVVLIGFTGTVQHSVGSARTYLNIAVDGVDYIADDGITGLVNASSGETRRIKPLSFVVLVSQLSAGSHIFKLRWKTTRNNTTSMDVVNLHPQFWAKEI